MGDDKAGCLFIYSEAVNFLLLTYARESYIERSVEYFEHTIQKDGETELTFARKLLEANRHCGLVYSELLLIQCFNRGLTPAMKALLANSARARILKFLMDAAE